MDANDDSAVRRNAAATPLDGASVDGDFDQLDRIISGSRTRVDNPAAPADTDRLDLKGITPWSLVKIGGNLISQHAKSVTLVCTVLVSVITIVLSVREVQTSRENFRIEMAAQARSTSALLFNDYLNELRVNYPDAHKGGELDAAAAQFLGAQTQFILNGVSDHKFRAEILTFLGVTRLSAMLKPTLSAGKIEAPLSLDGMSFDDGTIRGDFQEGLFAWNSFRNVTLDNVAFSKASLQYTDFSGSTISQGSFAGSELRCVSLANVQIVARMPSFKGAKIHHTDLRGLSISKDIIATDGNSAEESQKERLLAGIFDGAEFNNVLMDAEVALHLNEVQREQVITDNSMDYEQWIDHIKGTRHCNNNQS